MNKLTCSFPAKVTAIFLFVITVMLSLTGAAGIYLFYEYGFYRLPLADIKKDVFEDITRGYAYTVFYEYFPVYRSNLYEMKEYQEAFSHEKTNFRFVLKDPDGRVILSNYLGEEYLLRRTYQYEDYIVYSDATGRQTGSEIKIYTIDCYVARAMAANDRYMMANRFVELAYKMRYAIIPITALSFIAAIIVFIFLMCCAGRKKGEDRVVPGTMDKIPLDILGLCILIIFYFQLKVITHINVLSEAGMIMLVVICAICDILLALMACMSFATRCKLGGWWKNTVVYRVFSLIRRIVSRTFGIIKYLITNIPLVGKTVLVILAISLIEFISLASVDERNTLALLWFLERLVLVPIILLTAIGLQKLQIAARKMAEGDAGYHVDTRFLFLDLKKHGQNLNSISEGISRAVDERLKSERFKTELITNVSHDIKTPLTSIINYVDLIKKEKIENETLKEYIDVLDRQSTRLKKLTEDLVEASKASTGNIEINWARTEIGVLLAQTVGEYEEKLKDIGIELILKKPEEEVFVMADGRLLWRVFDNLMNNICKYAQPSTRAYINLDIKDRQAVITFRNISKYPLNISSDELLERFVRGDSSRNTEGSGLGLSIAKSLTELQHGKLDLYVDGDLFKIVVSFEII